MVWKLVGRRKAEMSRVLLTLVLLLAAACVAGAGAPLAPAQEAPAQEAPPDNNPNIIYVVADDADKRLLFSMPNIKRLLVDEGTLLENFYIPQALCCPSRTTVLTGQYTHNHQVVNNNAPTGGFRKYANRGLDAGNVAGPVGANGYSSALVGKFLNEYGPETSSSAYEGANWTRWFSVFNQQRYDAGANDNGRVRTLRGYVDNAIWREARSHVFGNMDAGRPVFTYWSPLAPHSEGRGDYPAPPGYAGINPGQVPSVNDPAYNEADVSDKPSFVRSKSRLSAKQKRAIQRTYAGRYRMLKNVDDQVKELWDGVVARGQQDNTYLIVTSDNGWHQGEHRIGDSKLTPYEEASNVGLAIRGPGIPAGVVRDELAGAHDLYATFTDMADGAGGTGVDQDGRSLLPMLGTPDAAPGSSPWRRAVLLENLSGLNAGRPNYYGIVTNDERGRYKYVEYANGEKELYDLEADPDELDSFDETADPLLLEELSSRLAGLKDCAGESCRAAEDAP